MLQQIVAANNDGCHTFLLNNDSNTIGSNDEVDNVEEQYLNGWYTPDLVSVMTVIMIRTMTIRRTKHPITKNLIGIS